MNQRLEKLSSVQILIELENDQSQYPKHDLEAELKNRNLSEKAMKQAINQRDYVLTQRTKKAETPLSIGYILLLLITPFGLGTTSKFTRENRMFEHESHLANAGFEKKVKQVWKYRIISAVLWSVIIIGLVIYTLSIRN